MTEILLSFEETTNGKNGDLLSQRKGDKPIKIGLCACGYFEYWRMYPGLREKVVTDMDFIASRLKKKYHVIYPGMIDSLDAGDNAGEYFRNENIDVIIITEGTYCPDYFVHQVLGHLGGQIPILCFASQPHRTTDFSADYGECLRNSGTMGLVQLTGGFRKMGKYKKYESIVGSIDQEETFDRISKCIDVYQTLHNLKQMTIGTVGHVFRGMYDFNYDKTSVSGLFGPHLMDVQIGHLVDILNEISSTQERLDLLCEKTKSEFQVSGLSDDEIRRSSRLAIALDELIERYKLDGLVLLGQHLVEKHANASCYLGIANILSRDRAIVVTEGDVIGCIMSKICKDLTGVNPFFGEWEEIDIDRNAVFLLGHGFIDPKATRRDSPVKVGPACENWGFQGNSVGFEATYPPGPVTLTHAIQDPDGWRLLVSEGEHLDTPVLPINECSMIVRVEKKITDYFQEIMSYGFSHHVIVTPGLIGKQLEMVARQLGMKVCRI